MKLNYRPLRAQLRHEDGFPSGPDMHIISHQIGSVTR